MLVSVLISTRNRVESLARMVESLRGVCVKHPVALEVVVVDNGSTDATPDYLRELGSDLAPGVSLLALSEPRPGKSRALNQAIRKSHGELLAFIDDDITVSPDWLEEMVRGFQTSGADALQGGVRLHLETPPAWWLTPRAEAILAATTLWGPHTPVTEMVGSNMAVRRLHPMPDFNEEIGPGAGRFPFGEDSLWSRDYLKLSRKGAFWPQMLAWHHLGERISLAEILKRQYFAGVNALINCPEGGRLRFYVQAWTGLLLSGARALVHRLLGNQLRCIENVFDAARCWGTCAAPTLRLAEHPYWRSANARLTADTTRPASESVKEGLPSSVNTA